MKAHHKTDQAVYLVTVQWKDRILRATVVCCIISFDEAAELACEAIARHLGESIDEMNATSIEMLTDPLAIE